MIKKNKREGLVYKTTDPSIKEFQAGGSFGGYGANAKKDPYQNAFGYQGSQADTSMFTQKPAPVNNNLPGSSLNTANIGTRPQAQTISTKSNPTTMDKPELLSGNDMKPAAPDVGAQRKAKTDVSGNIVDGGIKAAGAGSAAGTAAGVLQTGFQLLDDKDPYTYKNKEATGTAASGAVSGAVAGLGASASLIAAGIGTGAVLGSTLPVIGTVVGAVVGLGVGIWKASKKKKEAKDNRGVRDRATLSKQAAEDRKRLSGNDLSQTQGASVNSPSTAGTPGGYAGYTR